MSWRIPTKLNSTYPRENTRVAFRFDSHVLQEISGLFMMHCHQLIHEDRGMMGQFKVVI
ncbi:MAG: multicopper oxidase domain-containing protein [Symploca sp. SIO2E6]|nr:multicopper oxidase domain-containing protein [Symploca sp. SIO2E6]